MSGERTTRWGMVVVGGLVMWLAAVAWPGWSISGLPLGALTVAWATFGLLTE